MGFTCRVHSVRFCIWGSGFKGTIMLMELRGSKALKADLGFRDQGLGFGVQGLRFRV